MIVMMCLDCFSKIVQLVTIQESNAHTIADKLLSIVVSQYRIPACIISDHEPQFYSNFWDELIPLLDMTPTFNLALHPQNNGMTEVLNHTME